MHGSSGIVSSPFLPACLGFSRADGPGVRLAPDGDMSLCRLKTRLVLALLLVAGVAHAAGLDDDSANALAETLRGLTPGAAAGAPAVDPRLGSLGTSQEFYEVAGQVLTELTERCGGDPDKMSEALVRGKNDPEGFMGTLSPALRARLKALADKAPAATP